MLTDEIRTRLVKAMKEKDEATKSILRVMLGEIQTAESSSGETLDDEAVVKILRKLVKSNEETLAAARPEQIGQLEHELRLLRELLPQTLSKAEIVAALAPVLDQVRGAKADGPATGIAMKHLKSAGAAVTGQEVAAAVHEIRG